MIDEQAFAKVRRKRQVIFWILAWGYVLVYFHRLCPAIVAVDMMKDLSADGTLLGLLGSAYFYPYAAMQLPAGLLSDSWGPRRTITLFFAVAFVGSLILGFAPGISMAVVGRVLVGLGVSMLFVPTMKILAEWFEVAEFSTMTGILMAMGGLGSLIAASPLAAMSSWLGWRASFIIVGVFTLLLAALVWLLVRDRPSDFGLPSPNVATAAAKSEPIGLMQGIVRVAGYKAFWPLAVWFFFTMAIFFSFAGLWGGPYLMQVYGLSKAQAGRILSMCAVGMIIGSPLLSILSNRLFRGRKPVIVIASLVNLAMTLLLWAFTADIPPVAMYCLCLSIGVFTSAIVTLGFTVAKELFPVGIAGTSTGLANIFPFAGGAVFQPLVGAVLEANGKTGSAFTVAGYRQAFLLLTGCALIALISSLFLKETLKRA